MYSEINIYYHPDIKVTTVIGDFTVLKEMTKMLIKKTSEMNQTQNSIMKILFMKSIT